MSDTASGLQLPIDPYEVAGYRFGQRVRSRKILWARHLGDDVLAPVGTSVVAIGDGVVVWSEMRVGNKEHRNWGGVVIIEHTNPATGLLFYSVYGHIADIAMKLDEKISKGQNVGIVAPGNSPENGYWKLPHLHFGIYVGPWMQKILPGYSRPFEGRTKFRWWQQPQQFIEEYNQSLLKGSV